MVQDRFTAALAGFSKAHQKDPRQIRIDRTEVPWSVHYHRRLDFWVRKLCPSPSEAMLLASHCQHLRRWEIPRQDFPMDRQGYRKWRRRLADFHAEEAGRILLEAGYEKPTVDRVTDFLKKRGLRLDPEVQLFEDAVCLVFFENQLSIFSGQHVEEKVIGILRKTWRKMSPRGQNQARELAEQLDTLPRSLLKKALDDPDRK